MSAPLEERRLVVSSAPPLSLCAVSKMAVQLFQEFGIKTLDEAFSNVQTGRLTRLGGRSSRATAVLLHIPAHLRQSVREAVQASFHAVVFWKWYFGYLFGLRETEGSFEFRWDGTIDADKSAQNLVRNAKLDIKKRFKVACVFCLADSIEALWAEMEKTGGTESFQTSRGDVVHFWVGWLNERPRVTSAESFVQSLGALISRSQRNFVDPRALAPRFSVIFPLLRPEDRENCLDLMMATTCIYDVRFCLHALTRKEEEKVLQRWVVRVLVLYLTWPLQTFFLETASRVWDYIDVHSFRAVLANILKLKAGWEDFDYSSLFDGFWSMSPSHWRENWKDYASLKRKIDFYFLEKRRRGKSI